MLLLDAIKEDDDVAHDDSDEDSPSQESHEAKRFLRKGERGECPDAQFKYWRLRQCLGVLQVSR